MKLTEVERILIRLGLTLLKRDYEEEREKCNDEVIKKIIADEIESIEKLKEKVEEDVD